MIAAIALMMVGLGEPVTVQVESLPFDPAALKKLDQIELKVVDRGTTTLYKGVPLAALLPKGKLTSENPMAELRSMSDAVILVRGSDGYQAAVSAVAVMMDEKGERFFLALEKDGKALDEGQGPAKLIIPADPKHARWVHSIAAVDLLRAPKPPVKVKPAPGR